MTWSYRVVLKQPEVKGDIQQYGIHEVHYDADGEAVSVSVEPVRLHADTLEELTDQRVMMRVAMQQPWLLYEEIVGGEGNE